MVVVVSGVLFEAVESVGVELDREVALRRWFFSKSAGYLLVFRTNPAVVFSKNLGGRSVWGNEVSYVFGVQFLGEFLASGPRSKVSGDRVSGS